MHPEGTLRRRLVPPAVALAVILAVGTAGYWGLGGGRWDVVDCLYMTVITLTTVGYGEVLTGMDGVAGAREFTLVLIAVGMGVFLYVVSLVTATIVEGEMTRALRMARMRTKIAKLRGHVVVCGAGATGVHLVEELVTAERPCVAVDLDPAPLEAMHGRWGGCGFHYLAGDATDDTVLEAANITAASGLVAALPHDKDNLYLVVTARQMNQEARVVARGSRLEVLDKLRRAGADAVVSPNVIGGMRMASELLRPHVVRFLDDMLRDRQANWRVEEVAVSARSDLVGTPLAESRLRSEHDVAVLAVREPDGAVRYNPGGDFAVRGDSTLIVLGRLDRLDDLRRRAAG